MRYSWILFDADGTLFDYDSAETAALTATFRRFGRTMLPEHAEAYRRINNRHWEEFERGETTQERLRIERFEVLFEEAGIAGNPAEFSGAYLEELAVRAELIDGAEKTLAELAGNVRMLLITNGLAQVQRPRFAASTIHDQFAGIVISEELGIAKPDPRIFDTAFKIMGSPPRDRVLMVGDSLSSDIAGGLAYGIDTCWFNPAGKHIQTFEPTYQIAELTELLDLVGIETPRTNHMSKLKALAVAVLLTGPVTGCGTVSHPALPPTTPSDFNECSDHYLRCRDRCAPREVDEATCYRDHDGRVHRVCTCKESISPDDPGVHSPEKP